MTFFNKKFQFDFLIKLSLSLFFAFFVFLSFKISSAEELNNNLNQLNNSNIQKNSNSSNFSLNQDDSFQEVGEENFVLLKADNFAEKLPYSTLADWVAFSPYLTINNFYYSEIENTDYCLEDEIFCDFIYSPRKRGHLKRESKVDFIDKDKISFYLTILAEKTNRYPEDAKIRFNIETNKVEVVSPEKNGLVLNVSESINEIVKNISTGGKLPEEINLVYEEKKADIRSDDLERLGIKEMISEGYSTFKGSTLTRIHNIKTAIQRFDGWVIKPGEEVSFVQRLGEVDGEHGYKQELVIKNNKTEKEFGGGICQVSTTTFRAAIFSGLQITARRNHAYAVHYYDPQGMDAAVYIPKPDLKFVNNTSNYILVHPEIREETKELFFRFYGTKDGRNVEVKNPVVYQRNPDGSMRTYFTQKVTDKNGKVILDETFRSFYDSPSKFPRS